MSVRATAKYQRPNKTYAKRKTLAENNFKKRYAILSRNSALFEILAKRRETMATERRTCGSAVNGQICSTCRPPQPSIQLDEGIKTLIESGRILVGPEHPSVKYPEILGIPTIDEASRCPYSVANEALYHEVLTGLLLQSYLQQDYRSICRDIAKEVKRSINAIRDCCKPHLDSLLLLEQIAITTKTKRAVPVWTILEITREMEKALPNLRADATSRAGPVGDVTRQGIFLAMLKAWKELTGQLPAKGNTKFHGFAEAAVLTVKPDDHLQYSPEAATKIALKVYKKELERNPSRTTN